jgi:hypothetical protein
MFFKGRQQPAEFARGAWAVCDLMVKVQEGAASSSEATTAALADEFNRNVANGGEYSRGFVTGVLEFLAFYESSGTPNLDVWRPLEMELLYTWDGCDPTPGSKLFEYRDIPVSVAPDQTVHIWPHGENGRVERSSDFLQLVITRGRPISPTAFNALRAKTARGSNVVDFVGWLRRQPGAAP